MKRLGIVVAMCAEAKPLSQQVLSMGQTVDVREGILVHLSGIGKKQAAHAARSLLNCGVTALLSWGTAGGLTPVLGAGTVILPYTVVGMDSSLFRVDVSWHERLWKKLEGRVSLDAGSLVESLKILVTPEDKKALASRANAVATDMESAAVARVAAQAGIPFMTIRVILDTLDQGLPLGVLSSYDASGGLIKRNLFRELIRHPEELPKWICFAANFRRAQKILGKIAQLAEWGFLAFD